MLNGHPVPLSPSDRYTYGHMAADINASMGGKYSQELFLVINDFNRHIFNATLTRKILTAGYGTMFPDTMAALRSKASPVRLYSSEDLSYLSILVSPIYCPDHTMIVHST